MLDNATGTKFSCFLSGSTFPTADVRAIPCASMSIPNCQNLAVPEAGSFEPERALLLGPSKQQELGYKKKSFEIVFQ